LEKSAPCGRRMYPWRDGATPSTFREDLWKFSLFRGGNVRIVRVPFQNSFFFMSQHRSLKGHKVIGLRKTKPNE
jgi:hypothetical protein